MSSSVAGRVIVQHGRQCEVWLGDGEVVTARSRDRKLKPICNDRVQLIADGEHWWLKQVNDRSNAFARVDRRGRKQLLAANIDELLIVCAPEPEPSPDLLERYLVAALHLNIHPIIILNKTDFDLPAGLSERLGDLEAAGFSCLRLSAKHDQGVDALREQLTGKTVMMAGQSGVGKSTLTNALLGEAAQRVGELSDLTGKGAHTTSTTTALPLSVSRDTWLIDSPGVWEYTFWQLPEHEIENAYPEMSDFIGRCRFANCTHCHEPGCAVRGAVDEGYIKARRLESYQRLVEQNRKYAPEV